MLSAIRRCRSCGGPSHVRAVSVTTGVPYRKGTKICRADQIWLCRRCQHVDRRSLLIENEMRDLDLVMSVLGRDYGEGL